MITNQHQLWASFHPELKIPISYLLSTFFFSVRQSYLLPIVSDLRSKGVWVRVFVIRSVPKVDITMGDGEGSWQGLYRSLYLQRMLP